ncbi:MAG: glycoside hydrolase family 99-like domain-containing protein [Oceanospirillaceae bacterium]|nr:glycoside hydrolase family 99-like domain-containing protein [Oceanospirillaceae bacterium]
MLKRIFKEKKSSKIHVSKKGKGNVDENDAGYLTGWFASPNGNPAKAEIFIDGVKAMDILANKFRQDLISIGNGGFLGFSISLSALPISFLNRKIIKIDVLPESKLSLPCFTVELTEDEYFNKVTLCNSGYNIENIERKVIASGLWDEKYYYNKYLKEYGLEVDALKHFILVGGVKGYNPSSFFNSEYYYSHNDDVKEAKVNPLSHYIEFGEKEGRNPNDYFSPRDYREANSDLVDFDGLLFGHYVQYGISEGRPLKIKSDSKLVVSNSCLTSFELAKTNEFENLLPSTLENSNDKVIAYYLPQFHPFKENNEWWGKGFTEWTNVTKAKPLAVNQLQPRYPTDLGYYDLRIKENIVEQVELAKQIGVDSFCFYYYWFNGKILMETPLETIYKDPSIDTEYCICWANENWTKAWDGMEKDILIEQTYSDKDDIDFISHVSKYFKDARYTKVNGRPLMIIYRPSLFPDMKATLKRWRKWCLRNGVGDIHVVMVQFDDVDPNEYGFDAAVEFPPHRVGSQNVSQYMNFNGSFTGSVHDYNGMVSNGLNKKDEGYTVYKGVTMAWDNTARRNERASFFVNSTPARTERWLNGISKIYDTEKRLKQDRLVFVNAWNEWAEGTYLEPDAHYGHAYANSVARFKSSNKNSPEIAVLAHIFYEDLIDEIIDNIKNIPVDFDLLITCVESSYEAVSKKINEAFPDKLVDITVVLNKGRDIAPFLLNHVESYHRYKYICKIHSKKSLHAGGIDNWRGYLYERLLGSEKQIKTILKNFEEDEYLGIQYPEYSEAIKPFIDWGSNKKTCQDFMSSLGLDCPDELPDFPAGSMFWFRPASLNALLSKPWDMSDFPEEKGQVDETVMHAVERCLLLLVQSEGFRMRFLSLE